MIRFLLLALFVCMASCERRERASEVHSLEWRQIGKSVEARPIRFASIGNGPRRVLWIGGIHGNEQEGRVATQELPAACMSIPGLLDRVCIGFIEDLNPDGTLLHKRNNKNGVDLNRNYPAKNYKAGKTRGPQALSEPEAKCLYDLLKKFQPQLVIVAHSWSRRKHGPKAFVNFDGPAQEQAALFSSLSTYPVVPSAHMHGTPGSLGSLVGIDWGIPILTIEYQRGADPLLCWQQTREAILAVIDYEQRKNIQAVK